MPINLKNEEALKKYIARLVYHGGDVDTFTALQLKDVAFITAEKDKVIRAMTYQWMKKNVREYLTDKEDAPFLERVTEADEDAPEWLKKVLKEGKPVYIFDETKVPDSFHADLQNINDYLYSSANNYLDKVLKQKNPSVSLDALKQRPEHKDFALTLYEAKKWHEEIARQAAERKIKENEKQALEQGTEVIMNLGDGFKAVRLLTPEALDKESDYMGHCVGWGGYDNAVKDGTIWIVSIRDKNSEPHATFEIRAEDKTIWQCKGKANKPVVAKYIPYVQKFVLEQNLDPINDLKSMWFYRDINGSIHSIYNIPEGTVFYDLDLVGTEIAELPDLSKCIVNRLYIGGCSSLTSLKGCPERLKEIDCRYCNSLTSLEGLSEGLEVINCSRCSSLTSLEGCPESVKEINCWGCSSLSSLEGCPRDVKEVNCYGCNNLKYIPDYIPDEVIKGLSKEKIAECKANWLAKNKEEATKNKLGGIISSFRNTH